MFTHLAIVTFVSTYLSLFEFFSEKSVSSKYKKNEGEINLEYPTFFIATTVSLCVPRYVSSTNQSTMSSSKREVS